MTIQELRQKYLDFFEAKGHIVIPSASLVPENDPTTLFTSSGMQPMVPYLLGQKHPGGVKITDSQKCFRTNDIEDVGDNRHTTFFEMLGNWSLGDYFKEEQIDWMWEFLTQELKLDPNRLYVTCFAGDEKYNIPKDDRAANFWREKFAEAGIEREIAFYDVTKNWWSRAGVPENMPEGEPGGPDSEIFWDFGEGHKLHENSDFKDEVCHVNCDCGRYFEIGNNVFMEYQKTNDGFEKLAQQNVDFGGGLERIAAALNDDPDVFKIDVFKNALEKIEKLSGKIYNQDEKQTQAFRVILDHVRAATFLIADGAVPSNKDQGYFTRRLIRRAVRFASDLDINQNFTSEIASEYISEYKNTYKNLEDKKDFIFSELQKEEEKFRSTLTQGIKEFEKIAIDKISAKDAFQLFATYGFPIEMTIELAQEKNLEVDLDGFNKELEKHQELSRTASAGKFKGGLADASVETTRLHTANHLTLAALRKVLGDHVYQKGSNITAERLRFDFSHDAKMTSEQIKEVENLVNKAIQDKLPVLMENMAFEKAKELGAMGVFEDKYQDQVKVYTVGDYDHPFSRELCGGPHIENTGELGEFKIKKEEASSAGVRRIKAILR